MQQGASKVEDDDEHSQGTLRFYSITKNTIDI